MRWSGYPIYRLLICLVIGIITMSYDWVSSVEFVLISITVVLLLFWSSTFLVRVSVFFKWINTLSIYCFFIFLGMLLMNWSNEQTNPSHFYNAIKPGKNQALYLELYKRLVPNQYNDRFYARLNQVDGQSTIGNVLVLLKREDSLSFKVGDQFIAYDDVSNASNERNPGDFNYAEYLSLINVHGQVYLDKGKILQVRSEVTSSDFTVFRNHLLNLIWNSGLHAQPAAIVQALVLGQRQHLAIEVTDNFRNAGVIHILALSGLHVGIILYILRVLTTWMHRFKYGSWIQSVVVIVLLWMFALLTGMSPSILRAVTMFSFVAIGMNLKRKGSTYHSLAISAFVLLMIDPKLLFQVGFQLSYTAVFFIVLLQPVIFKLWNVKNPVGRFFWNVASVTIAAQVGVAPLSLFYFHQFPGLFLVGNMILLPILPLIIAASMLLIVLLLLNIRFEILEYLLNTSLELIIQLVAYISSFETFIIKDVYLRLSELIFIYIALISVSLFFNSRLKRSRKERVISVPAQWQLHIAMIALLGWLGLDIIEKTQNSKDEVVLLHQAAGTAISISNQDTAQLYLNVHRMNEDRKLNSIERLKATTLLRNKNTTIDSLKNVMVIGSKTLQVIDQSAVYSDKIPTDVILLSHSPKIHLERVINEVNPDYVLVDGSNYHYYIERFKRTCYQLGIPFFNTYEVGAIDLINLEAYTQN